jgi:predicted kinase
MTTPGVLCFFCGRAGAGKSTLARQMSAARKAILICEDQWLVRLFDGAPTLEAYLERRGKIRALLVEYVPPLLAAGHCVIFDFGGNTIRDRQWVRSVFESVSARHELHYIVADESLCKQRVAARNLAKPAGVYWGDVSEATLDAVNAYFQLPTPEEGFTVFEHLASSPP